LDIVIYQYDNLNLERLNFDHTVVDSQEKLLAVRNGEAKSEKVLFISSHLTDTALLFTKAEKVFVPIENYVDCLRNGSDSVSRANLYLYLDLHHNASAAKMLQQLEGSGENQNGVFRLRRGMNKAGVYKKSIGDLIVLSKLFGEPQSMFQKGIHDQSSDTGHLILSVRFDGNVIAHLEYSSLKIEKELLDMEMSVLDTIVEFSSDRQGLSFLSQGQSEFLPLDLELILHQSLLIDSCLHNKITDLVKQIPMLEKGAR
jgi:hypothetical protein